MITKGKVTGVDQWQNLRTGEVVEAAEIHKPVGRNHFMITYLSAIVNLIEVLGNKKMLVVKYILKNMDKSTNTLIATTRELSVKCEVSIKTAVETLKILESAGIIKRKTGAIMVNAQLVHQGNVGKERALMARFHAFDEQLEGQMSLDGESDE